MLTAGKIVRFIGEVSGLSTEKILTNVGKYTYKLGHKIENEKIERLGSKSLRLGEVASDKICKVSKNGERSIDELVKRSSLLVKDLKQNAFNKNVKIYGEAKEIYGVENFVEGRYEEKD
ncbi:hypothetical protein [Clostridium folliculivorans]|uniref:Uncharacterized protein n=1 Tax=Clostridium folliculivorans TaxID=2886038 RepID=A0A9W5XYA9_9CLOT|nr:hypothetical protein [Clostridium folliculivorans]GKU23180.1 hypothetical protein CFOLD11_00060 [Clostridium folliculivorans]GKU29226.1 hypothetical protein CFB3_13320 [Clostridium folliculivorans]